MWVVCLNQGLQKVGGSRAPHDPPPPHFSYALAHAQHFAQRAIDSLETHTHFSLGRSL